MYLLTTGAGMSYAYPDCCYMPVVTAAGTIPTPTPLPNLSYSAVASPSVDDVTIDCMPAVNNLSYDAISSGDETGTLGGLVSATFDGETMYMVGCVTITVGGAPAQRLASVTGNNCLGSVCNTVGGTIVASQYTVLGLG